MIPGPVGVGATYLPAETGVHLWHALDVAGLERDLGAIRALGFSHVRLHLGWDAFMPTHRQVSRHRLGELEKVLEAARRTGLGVVPVLFAQTHGDCVLLPTWAVDRSRPRRGVRVVADGVVVRGGPRDLYADPLMIEVSDRWLRALLGGFANHPAIAAWDLGHDPATTVRPRRIAELAAWVELMASTVRLRRDPVMLSLGAADVLVARGVRPATLAPHLDRLGLVVDPHRLPLLGATGAPDPVAVAFTLALALRLAAVGDGPPPLEVVTGVAVAEPADVDDGDGLGLPNRSGTGGVAARERAWDVELLEPSEGRRLTSELLGRLHDGGAAAVSAAAWSDQAQRPLEAPPLDRRPSLGRLGMVAVAGELRSVGEVWAEFAGREPEASTALPWPAELDVEAWYAGLPDSAADLLVGWRREHDGHDGSA